MPRFQVSYTFEIEHIYIVEAENLDKALEIASSCDTSSPAFIKEVIGEWQLNYNHTCKLKDK